MSLGSCTPGKQIHFDHFEKTRRLTVSHKNSEGTLFDYFILYNFRLVTVQCFPQLMSEDRYFHVECMATTVMSVAEREGEGWGK